MSWTEEQSEHTVAPPLLHVKNLSVSFGAGPVLRDATLVLESREIHGLLGANGSGKSTLIKALAGFNTPDPGAILERSGEAVSFPTDAASVRALGMSFVHQDLGLVDDLTVLENLRISSIAGGRRRWHISWRSEAAAARAMYDRLGVKADLTARVVDLTVTDRALLAIARAVWEAEHISTDVRSSVILLDEPTTYLPRSGIELLFATLKRIAEEDNSVVLVTHDLDEALEITDRITVLRDGVVCATVDTASTTKNDLIEHIVGRRLLPGRSRPPASKEDALDGVTLVDSVSGVAVQSVSVSASSGEVVGFAGLPGSGFDELLYLLFGRFRATSGSLRLNATTYDLTSMSPADAIEAGMVLLPADRQRAGGCQELPMAENVLLPVLREYFRRGRLVWREIDEDATNLLRQFGVTPASATMRFGAFSGGNQQKALLARCLRQHPRLLLLHEPTQGVDIGARQQISTLVREAAQAGLTIFCASTDHEQLSDVCDRVLVFRGGAVTAELSGADLTTAAVSAACLEGGP